MITPEDDSCIALVEACVEDALRKQCIEAMARAIYDLNPIGFAGGGIEFVVIRFDAPTPSMNGLREDCRKQAKTALDAAIASGYVIINRP